jgi:hypothetical protein
MKSMRTSMLVCGLLFVVLGFSPHALSEPHFVPNSQAFWDFSKNWTTNYGPAYRDTVEEASNFLACTGQFALCFHSGASPLPCKLTHDGRFANCTCTVPDSPTNYVLITAILNHDVYLETINVCGADGSNCPDADDAPVCKFLNKGQLIPGAELISTFDPSSTAAIQDALATESSDVKHCDGPFAGCMTAPCKLTKNGEAECSCPVFWGRFQLIGADAQCELGGDLVPSASYTPKLDPDVP